MSTLSGSHPNSDVLSESVVGKADDNVAHSKFESMKEGQDDYSSYAGGADEHMKKELLSKEASLDVCVEPSAMPQKLIKENGSMEVDIQPSDETDDSEMEEQDVKVCDICGDAGREELLAVCCQCSDGAEHTYCMRDMLEELPEGDWLCEECRSAEQVENEKQVGNEKEEKIEGYEKNSSSGQVSVEHVNNSDAEGQRAKGHVKTTGKRLRDDADAEVSSVVKKPATESVVKSPKTTPSSRIATLSREFSLRNPDKNGVVISKPESTTMASDLRGKDSRGTFSKSNSFNSLNSKPKVKLVDQVVFQRQKSAREHSSSRDKEGLAKSKVKTTSFKSLNSGRSESKTDTLSPRFSRLNDSKNTNQRSSYERQSSFRNDHPSTETGTGTSLNSTSRLEKKPVRPSSNLGDFKRPSLHSRTTGDNTEEKHHQISPKDDNSSQKAPSKANEALADVLSRPKDSSNAGVRGSGGRFHPPGAKSLVGENDALKAALSAAVLRKPELYRKHRDVASRQGQVSKVTEKKQFPEGVPERQPVSMNSQGNSVKQDSMENMKRFSLVPVEGLSSVRGLEGKYILKDMCDNIPAAMPLIFKSSAIPEQDYIWHGSFEIFRSGGSVELCDGLQAHLSTLASHNVNEAVNKFSSKTVLHEVPRLSCWPLQFQENGVREDNIALFFFAKDLESYEKIYKVMLDNMMKNDLALKGNINGVEVLIFPSNRLPHKAQRWNMFFFLWAVFRVKNESCLQSISESVPESRSPVGPSDKDLPVTDDDTVPVHKVPAAEKLCNIPSSTTANEGCDAKLPSLDRLASELNSRSSAPVPSDDGKQCQEPRATGSASGSGRDGMNMDAPDDRQQSSLPLNEYGAAACDTDAGKMIHDDTLDMNTFSNQDELQLRNNGDTLSPYKGTPLVGSRDVIDLNMECVEPRSPSPRTCHVLDRDEDASNEQFAALEKMENRRDVACNKINIFDYSEKGWEGFPLEQDRLHDRAPSLELALGAETTPLSQGILPLLLGKPEKQIIDEHVPSEVVSTADNEVSASLSLSLSFPSPEKAQSGKPGGSSGREHVNKPTLLFGSGLTDNEYRD